jgi:hypothetical protein
MRHAEKTNSIHRANHNLLAIGRYPHRLCIFEPERFSTATIDAPFAHLGKCIFFVQILVELATPHRFLDTFLTLWG